MLKEAWMRIKLDRRQGLGAIAATALLVAGGSPAAPAAQPTHGATYSGTIKRVVHSNGHTYRSTFTISFRVSASGKQVSGFTFAQNYPVYCQGGGFGSPQPKQGRVSTKGTFEVKLPLYFAPRHQNQGSLVITGKFGQHGTESGKVTTDFKNATSCNGEAGYNTRG
jgi:hypothetical protein